jgi:hypothetical protein
MSLSSAHYSYLPPSSLTQGTYYLSILSLEPHSSLLFTLDFLLEREYTQHMTMYLASSLELCPSLSPLPQVPLTTAEVSSEYYPKISEI